MKRDHYPMLDLLRGLAALLVLVFHLGEYAGHPRFVAQGYLAVDLFFMMSGFVIGAAYEPKLGRSLSAARFALLRLIRLYPVALLGLAIGVAVSWRTVAGFDPLSPAVLLQLLLLPVLWGADGLFPLDGPLWSLFFELVANVLHVAVLRFLGWRAIAGIAVAAAPLLALAILHHRSMNIGWGVETIGGAVARLLWGYCVGLALFRLHATGRLPQWRVPAWAIALAFTALIVVPSPFGAARGLLTDLFLLPPLLVAAIGTRLPERGLALAAEAGAISYPLYGIHAPILRGLAPWLAPLPLATAAPLWGVAALAILALAAAADRLYDRPVRRALSRLVDRRPEHAIATPDREKRAGEA